MYDFSHEDELELMYNDYFSKIYHYVYYRILHKEQTEDIVSEVFIKVAENCHKFDEKKANFNTWIFTITRNTLIDYYRIKKHLSIEDDSNNIKEPSIDFEEQCNLIEEESSRELYAALTKIDDRTRLVISLKHFEGLNNREISRRLGINESTVSTIYLRGLNKLKKILTT